MLTNYTPSVNIIRDADRNLNYKPTPNGVRAVHKIVNDFRLGKRSFNIIGSYGTGKSSFLWALEQSIKGKKHFFQANFIENPTIDIINIVGEYSSISKYLSDYFEVDSNNINTIFAAIYNRYHALGKDNGLLLLVIDEFGKFLEYASKNQPEKELYFLQQLAEFVNNSDYNIILLSSVHQNLDAYSAGLSETQRQEWLKIKGRFEEITFNEPVEQLIFLASEQISESKNDEVANVPINQSNLIFLEAKAFKISDEFRSNISKKIYPLDLMSAYTLTLALQRYGQNERSLFSFLTNTDYSGLYGYDRRTNPFYNLANVYDYLTFNFYNYLNSPNNTDFTAWSNIKDALERIESSMSIEELEQAQKLVKSVGLLNLFAAKSAKLDHDFLRSYAEVCLGFDATEILSKLEDKKILLYRNYANSFVVFQGTDIDLPDLLLEAANKVGTIKDMATLINRYFDLSPVFAKGHYYRTGTPRIFEFIISQEPQENLIPKGETDGYINLIFNDTLRIKNLVTISENQQEAVIYGYYSNAASRKIKDLLFEIEKIKCAIEIVPTDDKVAIKELREMQQAQEVLLNQYIFQNLFTTTNEVFWYYKGRPCDFKTKKEFNIELSKICLDVYSKAPEYHNELVNRHRLPAPIFTAKKNYIQQLVNNFYVEDLGFEKDRFPPEKTIFITLLKKNNLIPNPDNPTANISLVQGSTFTALWDFCEDFLDSTKKNRRKLSELVEALQKRPFKLKQGLIDFWLPSFLFIKRNDFALFEGNIYLANITDDTLELISKRTQGYEIKAFDVEGVRLDIFNSYRNLLNQGEVTNAGNTTFIETIRPFLTFYKGLDEYAKSTKRLQKETLAIRDAVASAKDPEKTFFEDFPQALGFTIQDLQHNKVSLEEYTKALQDSIRELRTCSDELINRFETFICSEVLYQELDFEGYKSALQKRFLNVKKHLLLSTQKTFIMRLESALDDRKIWLNSIAQAVIGKSLNTIKDEDEFLLYDKFKSMVLDLDNLTNLSEVQFNEDKEDIFKLEITTFGASAKKTVKLPKNKVEETTKIEEEIRKKLSKDKTLNIVALANVLKELLKK